MLSVPPLIFAMAGAIGFVTDQFSPAQVDDVRNAVLDLSQRGADRRRGQQDHRADHRRRARRAAASTSSRSASCSRCGPARGRSTSSSTPSRSCTGSAGTGGSCKTRALSFLLYVLAMVTGVVTIPLVVAGPSLVSDWLPERLDFLMHFYWPVVIVICICFLATLYHVSVPVRTNWSFNLPGATFSLFCWVVGSYVLRWFLTVDRGRLALDLRPARRADRRAAVALPGLDRGADRRGRQRRLRHRLPAEVDHARETRADATATPHRFARRPTD